MICKALCTVKHVQVFFIVLVVLSCAVVSIAAEPGDQATDLARIVSRLSLPRLAKVEAPGSLPVSEQGVPSGKEDLLRRLSALEEEKGDLLRRLDEPVKEQRPGRIEKALDMSPLKLVSAEEFNGTADLTWRIIGLDPSRLSFDKVPGSLTITADRGGYVESKKIGWKNAFLLDNPLGAGEDFVVMTRLISFNPTSDYDHAGLVCFDDEDNFIKFVYIWNSRWENSQPGLHFLAEREGKIDREYPEAYSAFKAASGTFWLCIAKRGAAYECYVSEDGEHARRVACLQWKAEGPKYMGLLATNGSRVSARRVDVSFDMFRIWKCAGGPRGHRPF